MGLEEDQSLQAVLCHRTSDRRERLFHFRKDGSTSAVETGKTAKIESRMWMDGQREIRNAGNQPKETKQQLLS